MMTLDEARVLTDTLTHSIQFLTVQWRRFNSCQAFTCKYSPKYDLIKSYSTIVGLVDNENQTMYELGKWSRTTSKQITQIHNQLYGNYELVRC